MKKLDKTTKSEILQTKSKVKQNSKLSQRVWPQTGHTKSDTKKWNNANKRSVQTKSNTKRTWQVYSHLNLNEKAKIVKQNICSDQDEKSEALQIKCLFAPTVKQKCTNPHNLFTRRMKWKNYTLQTKGLLTNGAKMKKWNIADNKKRVKRCKWKVPFKPITTWNLKHSIQQTKICKQNMFSHQEWNEKAKYHRLNHSYWYIIMQEFRKIS